MEPECYKHLPLVRILSQINPVHAPTLHHLKINLTFTLSSTPVSSTRSLCFRFHHQKPICLYYPPHTYYMSNQSHYSRCNHLNNICYRSFNSTSCSSLHSPVTSSLLGPNILLTTLFSNNLSLRSSLNVSDQISHRYKITVKIRVLHILIFKFLNS